MRSEVWNTTMSGQGEGKKAWKTLARKWEKPERRKMWFDFPCHVELLNDKEAQIVFYWFTKCSAVCHHWLLLRSLKDWDWLHPKLGPFENAVDTWKQWAFTLAKAKKCLCKPLELVNTSLASEVYCRLSSFPGREWLLIVMLVAYFFAFHILTCHICNSLGLLVCSRMFFAFLFLDVINSTRGHLATRYCGL